MRVTYSFVDVQDADEISEPASNIYLEQSFRNFAPSPDYARELYPLDTNFTRTYGCASWREVLEDFLFALEKHYGYDIAKNVTIDPPKTAEDFAKENKISQKVAEYQAKLEEKEAKK